MTVDCAQSLGKLPGCHDFHGNHIMKTKKTVEQIIPAEKIRAYFQGGASPYGDDRHYKAKKESAMISKNFWITLFSLGCLGIYYSSAHLHRWMIKNSSRPLFCRADAYLVTSGERCARAIWTKEIVGEGKKAGLKFDEHWRDADLEAGPLPALFLRETAKSMERSPLRLSLFWVGLPDQSR